MDGHLCLCLKKVANQPLTGSNRLQSHIVLCVVCGMYRPYELKLHGGTPFETGVELDPAQNIRG